MRSSSRRLLVNAGDISEGRFVQFAAINTPEQEQAKMISRHGPQGIGCAAAWALGLIAAFATVSVTAAPRSSVGVYAGNSYSGVLFLDTLVSDSHSGSGLSAIDNYSRDFTGLNGVGQIATEHLTASAHAQADFGALKVQANYALTNRLANNTNVPFVNADDSVNSAGVPTGLQSYAEAWVTDSVAVTAAETVAYLQFTYRLRGTVSATGGPLIPFSGPDSYVSVYDRNGVGIYQSQSTGTFDELIRPLAVPVVSGVANYRVGVAATSGLYSVFQTAPGPLDLNSSGNVDFFDTLQLVSVKGYSSSGAEVNLATATGATGFNYLLTAVPEPHTSALMLAGMVMLLPFFRNAARSSPDLPKA